MKVVAIVLAVLCGVAIAEEPSPPSNLFRIVKLQITGNEIEVTIAAGTKKGIRPDFHGHLVGHDGKLVEGGELVLVRVNETYTVARTKLSIERVRVADRARLVE